MDILFSIPVYGHPDRCLKQLQALERNSESMNFFYALHVNKTYDVNLYENFFSNLRIRDRIIFNSRRREVVSFDNLFGIHVMNFLEAKERSFNFSRVVLQAANEMYVRGGESLKRELACHDYGGDNVINHQYAVHYFREDERFLKCFSSFPNPQLRGSQWEGTFYSEEIFQTMAFIISNEYDIEERSPADGRGNIDECIFSSLASSILPEGNVRGVLCRADHIHGSVANMDLVKSLQENGYFSIKRVPVESHEFADQILLFINERDQS